MAASEHVLPPSSRLIHSLAPLVPCVPMVELAQPLTDSHGPRISTLETLMPAWFMLHLGGPLFGYTIMTGHNADLPR